MLIKRILMPNHSKYIYQFCLILILNFFCFKSFSQDSSKCSSSEYYKMLDDVEIVVDYSPANFYGPALNQKIQNLKLYDSKGNIFNLYESLSSKPVLLISGSYTCPKFRDIVKDINKIENEFSDEIDLNVVYINEAHPSNEKSVFFNKVNVGNRNIKDNIIYPQPVTYGDRLIMAQQASIKLQIKSTVIVDNPKNDFFNYFGASPTCAYIIDKNKKVALKIMVAKSQILYQKVANWVLNKH